MLTERIIAELESALRDLVDATSRYDNTPPVANARWALEAVTRLRRNKRSAFYCPDTPRA